MKAGKALPIVYDLRDFKGTALEREDSKMNTCIWGILADMFVCLNECKAEILRLRLEMFCQRDASANPGTYEPCFGFFTQSVYHITSDKWSPNEKSISLDICNLQKYQILSSPR